MSIKCQSIQIRCQSGVNPVPAKWQSIANAVPIMCQSISNPMPILDQYGTPSPIRHSYGNTLPICQSNANLSIQQKSANPRPIHQSLANPEPTKESTNRCQSLTNLEQSNADFFPLTNPWPTYANPGLIRQSITNPPIRYKSWTNKTIRYKFANPISILSQYANLLPIHQSVANPHQSANPPIHGQISNPRAIHLHSNNPPIQCQFHSNPMPIFDQYANSGIIHRSVLKMSTQHQPIRQSIKNPTMQCQTWCHSANPCPLCLSSTNAIPSYT